MNPKEPLTTSARRRLAENILKSTISGYALFLDPARREEWARLVDSWTGEKLDEYIAGAGNGKG